MDSLLSSAGYGIGVLALIGGLAILLSFGWGKTNYGMSTKERRSLRKFGYGLIGLSIFIYVVALWKFGSLAFEQAVNIHNNAESQSQALAVGIYAPQFYSGTLVESTQSATATVLVSTASPTESFTASEQTGKLNVVQFVSLYLNNINSALTDDDMLWGWDHLSVNLQAVSDRDPQKYVKDWFRYRVKYEIWYCDPVTVDVLLRYYHRSDQSYQVELDNLWVRYTLDIDSHDEWIFRSGFIAANHGAGCSFAYSN